MNNIIHVYVNNQVSVDVLAVSVKEVFKINDLEQVRLLADPFKLSIVQAFAEGERTTGDVAEALGQPVTKLYRHVDALHEAGLLTITREQKKRGTVERHFEAVGQRFEADHSLFADESESEEDSIRDVLRAGEDEIVTAIRGHKDDNEIAPTVVRLRIKATPERLKTLQQQLEDWVESIQQEDDDGLDENSAHEAGAMIAFYPINDDNKT